MTSLAFSRVLSRFAGAADIAVLMPLFLALVAAGAVDARAGLVGIGVAYAASAVIFRLPMPVQPLKSLAVLALAAGASAVEVRLAAAILGATFLVLAVGRVERLLARCPIAGAHALQLGLAVLLLGQAARMAAVPHWPTLAVSVLLFSVAAAAIALETRTGIPVLAAVTVATIVTGILTKSAQTVEVAPRLTELAPPRWGLLATMVLTQIPLTLGNSVVGTQAAARTYFGESAHRVTPWRLLLSMGVGNLLASAIGGMPFCHGSGGLTAHVRAGAREPSATAVFGVVLVAVGMVARPEVFAAMPRFGLATLLALTAVHHAMLARPSLQDSTLRVPMGLSALVTATTGNLLIGVLSFAAAAWIWRQAQARGDRPSSPLF